MIHLPGTILETSTHRYHILNRNKRNQHYMVCDRFGPDQGAWFTTYQRIADFDRSVGRHATVISRGTP